MWHHPLLRPLALTFALAIAFFAVTDTVRFESYHPSILAPHAPTTVLKRL